MIVIFKKVQIYGSKFVDKKLVVYFFAYAEKDTPFKFNTNKPLLV